MNLNVIGKGDTLEEIIIILTLATDLILIKYKSDQQNLMCKLSLKEDWFTQKDMNFSYKRNQVWGSVCGNYK